LTHFLAIIHQLPLLSVDSRQDVAEAKDLLDICKEYIVGLRMELKRKELAAAGKEPIRQAELAAYFTHCKFRPAHLKLTLASALATTYKMKNFQTAGGFARRLLDLSPAPDIATHAKRVAKHADTNAPDENKLNYDERNPFTICAITFTPIYKGSPTTHCPYCNASFLPEHKGKMCTVCLLSQIGKETSGLCLSRNDRDNR